MGKKKNYVDQPAKCEGQNFKELGQGKRKVGRKKADRDAVGGPKREGMRPEEGEKTPPWRQEKEKTGG